jgi:hypothetical protein
MCVTEIWTYYECCCQYLHPLPCYDRKLQSPDQTRNQSVNWSPTSGSSSSSLSSIVSRSTCSEAKDSISRSSPHLDTSGSGNETDDAYNHRLHLVRTCSLRRTVQKTFLEPICDDCLLLEIGLAAGAGSIPTRHGDNEPDDGTFDGAEWLLESSVDIIVEPPTDEKDVFHRRPKPRAVGSSSEEESEAETPRRGRRRRRAMDISRESLSISEGSPLKRRTSFQRLKQTGRHLRRARKQHDLKSSSNARPGMSQLSSTRPSSWIEHLKTDLGHRVRKKRHDIPETEAAQRTESSCDTSSSATKEDRILSLPSIPATASSAYSTASVNPEESATLPLDQIISSSEFDSSFLSDCHSSQTNTHGLHPTAEPAARNSTSTERSVAKSFHTASSTVVPPCPSPAAVMVRGRLGISLHPLSCPLLANAFRKASLLLPTENKGNEDDCRHSGGSSSSNEEEASTSEDIKKPFPNDTFFVAHQEDPPVTSAQPAGAS